MMVLQASTSTQHSMTHPRHIIPPGCRLHPATATRCKAPFGSLLDRFCGVFSPGKKPSSTSVIEKRHGGLVHVPEKPPPPMLLVGVEEEDDVVADAAAADTRGGEGGCYYFGRVFRYFDEDGDGKISPSELRSCMRTVGEELSEEDAEAVVESTDSDGDGLLGFEDFVRLVEVEGEEERTRDLREAFRMYATSEGLEGCITPKSLRRMLARLGEWKSLEECRLMIHRFDLNGDGVLSFDEFRVMML